MINETVKLKGDLVITVLDKDGKVKERREEKNLIVSAGLTFICSRMANATAGVMSHMAVGSGTTTPAASNTDLGTVLGAREPLDSTTASSNTVTYVSSFEAGEGTGAVTEAGLFNAASSGTMLCRTVFPVVNKGANDTMAITWIITLSAS
jgi:hypothetical protein|tara:strand:+ start:2226 stop:2675 length:450 start_codon:yes stop_codon:yes gene_type:complete